MSDLRRAAEMALEALEKLRFANAPFLDEATKALRQALAQPEQEPSKQFHEWACAEHQKRVAESANSTTSVVESKALAQPEQEQKTPLKVLNLTVFTENRLRNGRVYDVETLQAMTNRDILAIPDMGKKALKEVMEALDVYAVNMNQERVDETAKSEHDRAVELAQAYERGWNAALAQPEQEKKHQCPCPDGECTTCKQTDKQEHLCPEWDFMKINKDSPEFDACLCFPKPSLWFAIHNDGHVKYTTDSERAEGWKESGSYRVVRDYYTAPPKREWVGLTIEDYAEVSPDNQRAFILGARWAEQVLKEKNT